MFSVIIFYQPISVIVFFVFVVLKVFFNQSINIFKVGTEVHSIYK